MREIQKPIFVFVVDASAASIASGLLQSTLQAVAAQLNVLREIPNAQVHVVLLFVPIRANACG